MDIWELERLIEKVEGPLPVHSEHGEEIWRLELTKDERNTLADALYAAQRAFASLAPLSK